MIIKISIIAGPMLACVCMALAYEDVLIEPDIYVKLSVLGCLLLPFLWVLICVSWCLYGEAISDVLGSNGEQSRC